MPANYEPYGPDWTRPPEGSLTPAQGFAVKPEAKMAGAALELAKHGSVSSRPFTVPEPDLAATDRHLRMLRREKKIVDYTIALLEAHRLTLISAPAPHDGQ